MIYKQIQKLTYSKIIKDKKNPKKDKKEHSKKSKNIFK
jgi:hypothetical protein